MFYGHECYRGSSIGLPIGKFSHGYVCPRSFAALKRLAHRFPDLDVTVVAETHGYFSYLNPLPPEEEAEWLRRWHQDFHHLPGAFVVAKTPFWKLSEPDRRRIEETLPFVTSYAFGKKAPGDRDWVVPTTAFLIDRNGVILHADRLSTIWTAASEKEFADLIAVLLATPSGEGSVLASISQRTDTSASQSLKTSPDPNSSALLITDSGVVKLSRIVRQTITAVGSDTVRLREFLRILVTNVSGRKPRLLPGEETEESKGPLESVPEFARILNQEQIPLTDFTTLTVRTITGWGIVRILRQQGEEHAKEAIAGSKIKPTPEELKVLDKHYDTIEALMKQLQGLLF